MNVISIIIWVIANIPSLIKIVQEILDLIHNLPTAQRDEAHAQMADAYKSLRGGDAGPINALHDKLASAVGNPVDLKQD